jgi:ATP-dependent Clp protease adaptor protein ClpS
MDFVVLVLKTVFNKPQDEAVEIMLRVHHNGVGLCGLYPFEIAETKVAVTLRMAQDSDFPLMCSMEPA